MLHRRNFLKAGSISAGLSSIGLPNISFANEGKHSEKSVVWIWLGGGATQFETFHAPTERVPDEYKPTSGILYDPKTEIALGGLWERLYKHSDKLNVVNSFTHGDSSHRQGTHWVMTGQYNSERANTSTSKYPSYGSVVSSYYGVNHPVNGVPSYIKQGTISGEEPSWLGGAYKAFDPSNKDNLSPKVDLERFNIRGDLLKSLNTSIVDSNGAESFNKYNEQAYDVILGSAKDAFNIDAESQQTKDMYGNTTVGKQLLLARRLAEYGSRFITVHYGGWDMHGNIQKSLEGRVPPIDQAISAFLEDIWQRGMNENVLLVVTSEFGRTKLNANSGRDHWPSISTLMMAGGDYASGRTIGKSDRSYTPIENPIKPIDIAATLFNHFMIPSDIQRIDNGGRPRYLLEGEAKIIL
tara:strand:+ start:1426 stop:2655 length:1230 start_codon:yes stop_codon:yes gene_type:complete